MENCILCKENISSFGKYKISNGYICRKCYKEYPDFLRETIDTYSDVKLKVIREYFENRPFEKTAGIGNLWIDEIGGTFCLISDGRQFVFSGLDMEDGYINCTNIKADKYNHVFCDIEFYYKMLSPYMEFRTIVKKNVKCHVKKVGNNTLEWEEPAELSMFRNLFNQMLKRAVFNYEKRKKRILSSKTEIELLKAKALYMVGDDYTEDEIRETKRNLLKIYHPDEQTGDNEKTLMVLKYYELLLDMLKEDVR